MLRFKGYFLLLTLGLLLQGCSIYMASNLPLARPPERLTVGLKQERVDAVYGAPIAAGMNEDNTEYIEQIQFIDGVPMGWKIARISTHAALDYLTFGLWEFPGTIIEMCNADYPELTYFVVYNENNEIIRVIPLDSPEGQSLARLPWASEKIDLWDGQDGVNRILSEKRLLIGDEQRLKIIPKKQ